MSNVTTATPTFQPTRSPMVVQNITQPTNYPSTNPTDTPTQQPTKQPTTQPTNETSEEPTYKLTKQPTSKQTSESTSQPTNQPTNVIQASTLSPSTIYFRSSSPSQSIKPGNSPQTLLANLPLIGGAAAVFTCVVVAVGFTIYHLTGSKQRKRKPRPKPPSGYHNNPDNQLDFDDGVYATAMGGQTQYNPRLCDNLNNTRVLYSVLDGRGQTQYDARVCGKSRSNLRALQNGNRLMIANIDGYGNQRSAMGSALCANPYIREIPRALAEYETGTNPEPNHLRHYMPHNYTRQPQQVISRRHHNSIRNNNYHRGIENQFSRQVHLHGRIGQDNRNSAPPKEPPNAMVAYSPTRSGIGNTTTEKPAETRLIATDTPS